MESQNATAGIRHNPSPSRVDGKTRGLAGLNQHAVVHCVISTRPRQSLKGRSVVIAVYPL